MKKYSVQLHAFASASYHVEADTEEEAIKKAYKMASHSDCEIDDWDFDTPPSVMYIGDSNDI